jgi:hypothetical protein
VAAVATATATGQAPSKVPTSKKAGISKATEWDRCADIPDVADTTDVAEDAEES